MPVARSTHLVIIVSRFLCRTPVRVCRTIEILTVGGLHNCCVQHAHKVIVNQAVDVGDKLVIV